MQATWKKGLVLAIALVLLSVIGLAGCSKQVGDNKPAESEGNATAAPSVSPQASEDTATAEETPAKAELEPVTLAWYFPGTPQPEQDEVFDKVNSIIKEKINATVEFDAIDYGTYADKMKVKMAANEPYDLAFTAGWINPYAPNASSDAYLALDDLLPQYAAATYASMPQFMWDGAKVNGKIYGVPNYQSVALPAGMWFKKDLVDKYKVDLSKLKPGMSASDLYGVLGEYYAAIKAGEPDVFPIEVFQEGFWGNMLPLHGFKNLNTYADAVAGSDTSKVINTYDTPEFKQYMDVVRDWYKKGYIRKDVISNKRASNNPDEKAGKYFSGFTSGSPDQASSLKNAWGYDVVVVPITATFLQPGNFNATMTAISRTSKNPERALMLIDLLNTDKELYNLLAYGIEGKHYTKAGDNRVELVADSKYNPGNAWMFGSQFNAYVTPGLPDDIWEQEKKLNETAEMPPLGSFNLDKSNQDAVDKAKQVQSLINEYSPGMADGAIDGEQRLKEMLDKMNKAGLPDIVTEDLKQLAAWQSAQ